MLVISRKKDEAVLIGDNIEVKVVGVDGNNIKLAISAPNNISILRKEIYEKVKNENIKATNKNIKILKTTSITLIIMPLLLTVPILLNFEKSFIIFHKLLFRNDYWIFNPDLDPVINILPEEFFFHSGMMILILILLVSILLFVMYKLCKSLSIKIFQC
ncbi:carbon storage regulator [Clostridioides difficile]|nr:carbon storage regulator [Clostridioides difficile]